MRQLNFQHTTGKERVNTLPSTSNSAHIRPFSATHQLNSSILMPIAVLDTDGLDWEGWGGN